MARDTFVTTPYIHLEPSDVQVRVHTTGEGDPSAVLDLGPGVTMYVFDPAMLMRLAEVVAQAHDQLLAEISGQDVLPVDTHTDDVTRGDDLDAQVCGVA